MIRFDRFKDGKKHILTTSYDDGQIADRRLIEIFNKNGIRGTFHLNSGRFGQENIISADEVGTLFANHEVSVHTISHPYLTRIPSTNVAIEVLKDREYLENLCGYTVRGMSYPFGVYNDQVIEILKQCGIVYSRSTVSTGNFGIPQNFLAWAPTCHHNHNIMELADRFIKEMETSWRVQLFYLWGHSYEFNRDNNWDMIEEFCEFMGGRQDIWYATNIEIYDYITAQQRLQISVDNSIVYNPSVQTVWFENDGETVEIKGGETIKL